MSYFPEIRRIFDREAVEKQECSIASRRIAYWDRNYNTKLSEYLFASPLSQDHFLFDIAITGRLDSVAYAANGCGRHEAFAFLRKELDTSYSLWGGETQSKKDIFLQDAIALATGAVQYTTERNPFCRGLDYVIVRQGSVEEHFCSESFCEDVYLPALIEEKIEILQREIHALKNMKGLYLSLEEESEE